MVSSGIPEGSGGGRLLSRAGVIRHRSQKPSGGHRDSGAGRDRLEKVATLHEKFSVTRSHDEPPLYPAVFQAGLERGCEDRRPKAGGSLTGSFRSGRNRPQIMYPLPS